MLSGSLSVDNNVLLAQGVIHAATNALGIDAKSTVAGTSASVTSQQVVTTGSTVTVLTVGNAVLAAIADLDDAGSVAVSVDNNMNIATGIGGVAVNTLLVDAGASITGTVAAPAPVLGTATGQTTASLNADFNILNLQLGDASSIIVTNLGNTFNATNGTALAGDSITVNNNLAQTQAIGFTSSNVMILDSEASIDATATVANRQLIDGTTITASSGGFTFAASQLGADGSSVTVDGNDVATSASANTALNGLVVMADATLQESSGAGVVLDPLAASALSITGADHSVLNWQTTTAGTALTASISSTTMGVTGMTGTVDDSAIDVSDNSVIAEAIANSATNELVLNTGTFQHPSAAVANLQTTDGTSVRASVSGASIGIGLVGTISGANNSSFSVTGNSIGAVAIGNSSVNTISSGN